MSEIRGRHTLRKELSNANQSEPYGEASTDEEIYENEQEKLTESNASRGTNFITKLPREKISNANQSEQYGEAYTDEEIYENEQDKLTETLFIIKPPGGKLANAPDYLCESVPIRNQTENRLYSNNYSRSASKYPLTKNRSLQAQKCGKIQQESSLLQKWKIGTYAKCLCIVVTIGGYFFYASSQKTDKECSYQDLKEKYPQQDEIKECSYQDLKEKYPQQDEIIWHSLQVGIERILNAYDRKSGVYLFIHYENSNVDDIIEDIVKHASKCYNEKMKPIHMNISNFNSPKAMKDYGHIIEDFKKHIRKSKVIVVLNVNAIPPETARALHTLCDTESPIDKEVVVFLTLQVPKVPIDKDNDLESNVEKILSNLWSNGMESNELDPLITRVTNNVLLLKDNTSIETF